MPPLPPSAPGQRPRWARKRVIIPAAAVLFFVGVGMGSSGSSGSEAVGSAKPAPTVTVTATAAAEAQPAPTVTVTKTVKATKTVTAKPKAKKKAAAAPAGKVLFKVWGSAPSGVDITYGSDSENLDGHGLPMSKTLTLKDDAMYYYMSAQLQGGGDIHCSVTIDGQTKTGHASGSYNICSAQLSSGLFGDWS